MSDKKLVEPWPAAQEVQPSQSSCPDLHIQRPALQLPGIDAPPPKPAVRCATTAEHALLAVIAGLHAGYRQHAESWKGDNHSLALHSGRDHACQATAPAVHGNSSQVLDAAPWRPVYAHPQDSTTCVCSTSSAEPHSHIHTTMPMDETRQLGAPAPPDTLTLPMPHLSGQQSPSPVPAHHVLSSLRHSCMDGGPEQCPAKPTHWHCCGCRLATFALHDLGSTLLHRVPIPAALTDLYEAAQARPAARAPSPEPSAVQGATPGGLAGIIHCLCAHSGPGGMYHADWAWLALHAGSKIRATAAPCLGTC